MLAPGIDGIGLARVVCVALAQIAGRGGRSTRPFRFGLPSVGKMLAFQALRWL